MRKMFLVSAAMFAVCVHADVFDDVKFWFNGASDLNSDGVIQTGELVDRLHCATAGHAMNLGAVTEFTPGDIKLSTEDVEMPYRGIMLPSQKVIFCDQGKMPMCDDENVVTNHSYELGSVSFPAIFPATNNFTVVARFKFHEFMNAATYAPILTFGYKWGADYASQGLTFQLGTGASSHNDLKYYCSTRSSKGLPSSDSIKTNQWIDVAISVFDGTNTIAFASRANRIYVMTNIMDDISWDNTLANTRGTIQLGGSGRTERTTAAKLLKNYARVSFAQVAVWQRVLSLDEVKEAFMGGYPDLLREGVQNGDNDDVSAELTEVAPDHTVSFMLKEPAVAVPAESFGIMGQLLRVSCSFGAGNANVFVNGQLVGKINLSRGMTSSVYVPAENLQYGENIIRISRTSGTIGMDSVCLGGSWQVGHEDDNYSEFGHNLVYEFGDGNWANGFRALGGVGNPNGNHSGSIRINVSSEAAAYCRHRFDIRARCVLPNRDTTNMVPMRVSVNGMEKAMFDLPYVGSPWPVFSVVFDPGTFEPGWNTIRLDHAGILDLGANDYISIDCFRLHVTGKRKGFVVFVR